MDVRDKTEARRRLHDIVERLKPDAARARALAELDEIFVNGQTPSPPPEGMLRGTFITMSVWGPVDSLSRRVAEMWMPWLGKSFDGVSMRGVNVLTKNARGPMRALWPSYVPERELADRIEAFPFRNRIAPGELDPEVDVLKIDYDFEGNPNFLIRRILDELVEIEDGFYLGKILFRRPGSWLPIGFFALER